MYNEAWEKRYSPGKRKNSFYMDQPKVKSHEKRMEALDRFSGYTYYLDGSGSKLIREKWNKF